MPLPHGRAFGLSLREGGKKREKPRFLRMGGEEKKGRRNLRERERKSADMRDRDTDVETQRWGERPPFF